MIKYVLYKGGSGMEEKGVISSALLPKEEKSRGGGDVR
jgi:hypothetical protein